MTSEELFSQLSLWMVKCTPFASNLYYLSMLGSESVLGIRIRIHKAPEYGSGSTTLVTRDTRHKSIALDPHLFFADPAVSLNADPDPAF